MALINVIKFEGPADELAWKWGTGSGNRGNEIRLGSQLIVNPSQEAIFIKGGKVLDIFGPGTYSLHTDNLPLLAGIVDMAFGGNSPFEAEVYFVNKAVAMGTKWGLIPFNLMEPTLKVPLPVSARG